MSEVLDLYLSVYITALVAKMVCRCVAAGCSSESGKDGASLFKFPKDENMRKKWADQVKRTREKWEPTKHSVLCRKHFEDWCFEQDSKLYDSFGLGKKQSRLKSDAVPTLFEKPALLKRTIPATESNPAKKRPAYAKLERVRVNLLSLML